MDQNQNNEIVGTPAPTESEESLEAVVAQNLAGFRRERGLTQAELAERLNYSDKSVSKWERGDSIPDVRVLIALADLYGVSLDALLGREGRAPKRSSEPRTKTGYRVLILCSAVCAMWILVTAAFSIAGALTEYHSAWILFPWGVVISALVMALLGQKWKFRVFTVVARSILCWSFLTALYLQCLILGQNLWMLFFVGIPVQGLLILLGRIRKRVGAYASEPNDRTV